MIIFFLKEYRKYQREFNTKIKSKEKLLMEEKIKIKKFIKYRVKQIKEKTTNIKIDGFISNNYFKLQVSEVLYFLVIASKGLLKLYILNSCSE